VEINHHMIEFRAGIVNLKQKKTWQRLQLY